MQLPCLQKDLRTGSISRGIVKISSELCRRRSGTFPEVARLVPPGITHARTCMPHSRARACTCARPRAYTCGGASLALDFVTRRGNVRVTARLLGGCWLPRWPASNLSHSVSMCFFCWGTLHRLAVERCGETPDNTCKDHSQRNLNNSLTSERWPFPRHAILFAGLRQDTSDAYLSRPCPNHPAARPAPPWASATCPPAASPRPRCRTGGRAAHEFLYKGLQGFPFRRDFPLQGTSYIRDFPLWGISLYKGFPCTRDFPLQGISWAWRSASTRRPLPEDTKRATSVNVQLPCLRRDLRKVCLSSSRPLDFAQLLCNFCATSVQLLCLRKVCLSSSRPYPLPRAALPPLCLIRRMGRVVGLVWHMLLRCRLVRHRFPLNGFWSKRAWPTGVAFVSWREDMSPYATWHLTAAGYNILGPFLCRVGFVWIFVCCCFSPNYYCCFVVLDFHPAVHTLSACLL